MEPSLSEYLRQSFLGVNLNTLILGTLYVLVITDLRQKYSLDDFFAFCRKNKRSFSHALEWPPVKLVLWLFYYIFLTSVGLIGVFLAIAVLWIVEIIM